MNQEYNPQKIEKTVQKFWEDNNCYRAIKNDQKKLAASPKKRDEPPSSP